jgi:glycosyltransferase involved in cell wall biosynthesis
VTDQDDPRGGGPLVSVVIATKDREEMVRRAVVSVLAQTVTNIEVLVVDDASRSRPRSLPADPRVRVLTRGRSGGPCAARNDGLRAARGTWIAFLDDDDRLLPDMLERSLAAAEASELPRPVAVLSCSRVEDEETHELLDIRCPPPELPRGSRWFLEGNGEGRFRSERTLVAPVSVVRSIGGFDERFRAMEDKDLFLRLNAVCSIVGLQRETYLKSEHKGPKLLSEPLARAEGVRLTLEKHRTVIETDPARHAKLLGTMAIGYLLAGKWRKALGASLRAVRRDPKSVRPYLIVVSCLGGRRLYLTGSALWQRVAGGDATEVL